MKKHFNLLTIFRILIDLILSFCIFVLSFLSLGTDYFISSFHVVSIFSISASAFIIFLFLILKIYKSLYKCISLFDVFKIFTITIFFSNISYLSLFFVPSALTNLCWPLYLNLFPFSFLLTIILILSRSFSNFVLIAKNIQTRKNKIRTVVIGAGGAGKVIVDDSLKNESNKHFVVGMIDDDISKIGKEYFGVKVYGPIKKSIEIIRELKAEEVIIAINQIDNNKLHDILSCLSESNARIRRMPILSELNGPNETKIINIDFNDLLGREPIVLDNGKLNEIITDKTVLVTGAGGSIGSELARQIFALKPKKLILFDIYENSTYDIQMELERLKREKRNIETSVICLIGSTYNQIRMEQIFKKYRPDYVYHAAAYKHVPLMEDSPAEAIRTNVIGTYNVAQLADKYSAKKMVLVSTDKAVRPTNVMGATKRFAEMIIQYYSTLSKNTAYAAVRFGNVLGSNGSVVPLFKKQIELGGPITITDKRIIRYFMTIPEAVSLILQCGLFANGGEIFILDMGKPVKIIDLAERLIKQAGLVPYVDINIIEVGLRPGEKLYEELLLNTSEQDKTSNSRIFVEKRIGVHSVEKDIELVKNAFEMDNNFEIKSLLSKIIGSYKISSNVKEEKQ